MVHFRAHIRKPLGSKCRDLRVPQLPLSSTDSLRALAQTPASSVLKRLVKFPPLRNWQISFSLAHGFKEPLGGYTHLLLLLFLTSFCLHPTLPPKVIGTIFSLTPSSLHRRFLFLLEHTLHPPWPHLAKDCLSFASHLATLFSRNPVTTQHLDLPQTSTPCLIPKSFSTHCTEGILDTNALHHRTWTSLTMGPQSAALV